MDKKMLEAILKALETLKTDESLNDFDEKYEGVEVEKEHEDLYKHIKEMCGDSFIMTLDAFAEWIEKAHHKEDPDYYKKLKIMGL